MFYHQESLVGMNEIEEATHEVHDDVEHLLKDDVSQLHESCAVEVISLDRHDGEVKAGKRRPKDNIGAKDRGEADIEKTMEERAEIYLGDKTRANSAKTNLNYF